MKWLLEYCSYCKEEIVSWVPIILRYAALGVRSLVNRAVLVRRISELFMIQSTCFIPKLYS